MRNFLKANFESLFTEKSVKKQKLVHGVLLMDQNVIIQFKE